MTELKELTLSLIQEGTDRARPLDPLVVEALAASISEQGLMQPIVVREVDGAYHLIAGWHRLQAVRSLGMANIMVRVLPVASDDEAKLAEVMENLGRGELIALDRCRHLYDLKQVWERLYPEVKNGGDPATKAKAARIRNSDSGTDAPEIFGFVRACAEKIGLGRSQISEAVKIWTGLSLDSRQDLQGTKLATKMTELKALSELQPHIQAKVLDVIGNPDLPDVGNVAQALAYSAGGIVEVPVEKQFHAVHTAFSKLPDAAFDMVVSAEADRVIAALKRLGRI